MTIEQKYEALRCAAIHVMVAFATYGRESDEIRKGSITELGRVLRGPCAEPFNLDATEPAP